MEHTAGTQGADREQIADSCQRAADPEGTGCHCSDSFLVGGKLPPMDCAICSQQFTLPGRTPQVLPCGHTFCSECISRFTRSRTLDCPNCRQSCSASDVRVNFALRDSLGDGSDTGAQVQHASLHGNAMDTQAKPRGAQTRAIAWSAAVVSVVLMLAGAFGAWSIWLVGIAVTVLMFSNGVLIANVTYTEREEIPQWLRSQPLTDHVQQSKKCDLKTCIQGFAMLPVTMAAVVSLATYKANEDLDAMGGGEFNFTTMKPDSVALLDFLHLRHVLSHPSTGMESAVSFHHQFLLGLMCTSVLYLSVLSLHAIFMSTAPVDDSWPRLTRQSAHVLFGVMVTLLVFAAVGFWPLILGSVAFGLNVVACCLLLGSALFGAAVTPRMLLQVHAFMPVALACTYCFGMLVYGHQALTIGDKNAHDISLHYAGFIQALCASAWLAGSFAIWDGFNAWNTKQVYSSLL